MAKKVKKEKIDGGMTPEDVAKIKSAMRLVWQRGSHARKLCLERVLDEHGFPICEGCLKTVPKVFCDHTEPVGDLDAGYLKRLWISSDQLRSLCSSCHSAKTRLDNKKTKLKRPTSKLPSKP